MCIRDRDRGVYFASQLNLKKLTVQSTSYDFYTEIEPYGKDGLTIESVNGGKNYVSNYQYSSKSKRLIWKDERYTVPESLKADAQAKLEDMSKPYSSYSADIIDLAKQSEKYSILEYDIGDTVTILDGITEKMCIRDSPTTLPPPLCVDFLQRYYNLQM